MTLMCPAGTYLQMTTHNLFRLYALVICNHCPQPRGTRRTLILCLQFPIVTTTAAKPDSSPSHCTAIFVYVYQTPTFPPHYVDNVKVKWQHVCQAIPPCPGAWVKQWIQMTGVLVIAYDALHMEFSSQPPLPPKKKKKKKKEKKILTQNMTSADKLCNLFPSTFPSHH